MTNYDWIDEHIADEYKEDAAGTYYKLNDGTYTEVAPSTEDSYVEKGTAATESGYVLDAGRLFPNEKDRIGPSEMFHFNKLPPLVSHLILPNWSICFLLPKNDHYIEGKEEQKLFNEFTPIKQNETDAI